MSVEPPFLYNCKHPDACFRMWYSMSSHHCVANRTVTNKTNGMHEPSNSRIEPYHFLFTMATATTTTTPKVAPNLVPHSDTELRPTTLKAHSAPSDLLALIWVLFLDPFWGSQKRPLAKFQHASYVNNKKRKQHDTASVLTPLCNKYKTSSAMSNTQQSPDQLWDAHTNVA